MNYERTPFSGAEYDRRLALTRAAMEKAGIDVLVRRGSVEHGLVDGL